MEKPPDWEGSSLQKRCVQVPLAPANLLTDHVGYTHWLISANSQEWAAEKCNVHRVGAGNISFGAPTSYGTKFCRVILESEMYVVSIMKFITEVAGGLYRSSKNIQAVG